MLSSLVTLLLSVAAVEAYSTWTVGQQVKTTSGRVVGQASSLKAEVTEFLGVPFAAPPVGPLRWVAPQPYQPQGDHIIRADKFGPGCAESASRASRNNPNAPNNIGAAEGKMSEDCLFLNVWTKPQVGEKNKAVLVWIYGGGFVVGDSANVVYNGAYLAEEQDVVVVSLNYRLGVLGFPGVPLPDRNLGLLDQRAALEWLRENVEEFGGDPKRITVFGQSAGGASVDFMSYAYTKDPIVNAYIPQSGTAAIGALTSNATVSATAVSTWSKLSETLGCGTVQAADVAKTLGCMRGKSEAAILDATVLPGGQSTLGVWGPKIDNKTLFADITARRARGDFVHKPILVGNVDDEGATYKSGGDAISRMFGCPSGAAAKARRDAGVPAWRYLYAATWPNQQLGSCCPNVKGAWHGSEIALIFGTTELKKKGADLPAEKELGKKMRDAWAGFAKDPDHGLEKLGWPVYDPNKATVVVLGGKQDGTIKFEKPSNIDQGC